MAQMILTSDVVNRFPVALSTSSASSGLSSVNRVAICCSREKDSRSEPDEKLDWDERYERMERMSRSRRRAPSWRRRGQRGTRNGEGGRNYLGELHSADHALPGADEDVDGRCKEEVEVGRREGFLQ